jgi:hypothetical protein
VEKQESRRREDLHGRRRRIRILKDENGEWNDEIEDLPKDLCRTDVCLAHIRCYMTVDCQAGLSQWKIHFGFISSFTFSFYVVINQTMMRLATTPLLLWLVHWITVCVCLQGSQSLAWTTPQQCRIPERLLRVGSRDTLTRLYLENGGSNGNDKDEVTMQQQSTSTERQEGQKQETSNDKAASNDSSTSESPPPAARVPTTPQRTNTRSTEMTNQQLMNSFGTSPRRIFVSLASSTAIALSANFLGITSKLLEAVPEETVEASGLDIFFPVGDYKRCRGKGYVFLFPKEWVADTTVELAKAQRQALPLDYSSASNSRDSRSKSNMLPDAAFGPPGNLNARGISKGDTNVSVLRSPLPATFTLRGIGTPASVAERILSLTMAPKGSGRTATIVNAVERDVGVVGDRPVVYEFEYIVDRGERGPPLRAISVVCVQGGDGNSNNISDIMTPAPAATATRTLLTLTVVAPQRDWTGVFETKLRKIASSFHTTSL